MKIRLLIFCACFFVSTIYAKHLRVNVKSETAILIDADTGKVLFEKNADKKMFPASTTKVATALFAINKLQNLNSWIKVSKEPLKKMPKRVKVAKKYKIQPYYLEPDGTTFQLVTGEILTFRDLLFGTLMISGNDAANAIAMHISGSIEKFVDELNIFVKDLGCKNTHFSNPHGLHFPEHHTTAYDMAILMREAIKNPILLEMMSATKYQRPSTNKKESMELRAKNKFIKHGKFFYPYVIGAKIGYTENAKHTFVAAAKNKDRTLIASIFYSNDMNQKYRDAAALFDAAFLEKKETRKLFDQKSLFEKEIKGAKNSLLAKLKDSVLISYYPSEEEEYTAKLHWKIKKPFPISIGDKVGFIEIFSEGGEFINKYSLIAMSDVELSTWKKIKDVYKSIKNRQIYLLNVILIIAFFVIFEIFYKNLKKKRIKSSALDKD